MKNRPVGVTIIGYFYLIGAIILLASLGTQQEIGLNVRFGIPSIPELVVRIAVAVFAVTMGYGYMQLTKWGYWTMVIYSILFLLISLKQMTQVNGQPFIGNAIFSAIVLWYTLTRRNHFLGKPEIS